MNERPIGFAGEELRAILAGRKTRMRRIIKPQPLDQHRRRCPYGEPGDRLWVQERFRLRLDDDACSAIHMPRWASRITLEVTSVRVERLQQISGTDAQAEGVTAAGTAAWQLREAFFELWEQINGPGSWDANPWVWAVEFRRIEP